MASHCCDNKAEELARLRERQASVLKIVLAINAVMFFVEFAGGIVGKSTALLGDSLDMFGDATVYAASLFVLHKNLKWRSAVAFLKGAIMLTLGLGVLSEAIAKGFSNSLPIAPTIGAVGGAALVANGVCLYLLLAHRHDDINMRSTWLCSRNDIIANLGVIASSVGVWLTDSKWPDIIVGVIIAGIVMISSATVVKQSLAGLRESSVEPLR
jgi:cation diffusion facilitator family transporter